MNDEENVYKEIFSTKQCSTCRQMLSSSDFYKDSSKPDGYKSVCKECYLGFKRERYYSDKEKEMIQTEKKHKARNSYPRLGHCYETDTGEIVRILNIKKGKGSFVVLDVESLVPKSDVTQYSLSIWCFKRQWEECNDPFQQGNKILYDLLK